MTSNRPLFRAVAVAASVMLVPSVTVSSWLLLAPLSAGQAVATKLVARDAEQFDQFGLAVAIDGPVAVASAHLADGDFFNTGVVYVYRHDGSTWVEEAQIEALDPGINDRFGVSVDVRGDVIAVGTLDNDNGTESMGSTYVFRDGAEGWTQEAKLIGSDPQDLARFGSDVALGRDLLVVAAPLHDSPEFNDGAAFVFRRTPTGWKEEAVLTASDSHEEQIFGASVAIEGNVVAVGAVWDNELLPFAGAVYIYRRHPDGTWTEDQKIRPPALSAFDEFGTRVELDDGRLAVGVPFDDDGFFSTGVVYVFTESGGSWQLEQVVSASDPVEDNAFGKDISLHGDVLAVGASNPVATPPFAGATYLFRNTATGWREQSKIVPQDASADIGFGTAVAVGPRMLITGAYLDDSAATSAGSAYLHVLPRLVPAVQPPPPRPPFDFDAPLDTVRGWLGLDTGGQAKH